MLESIHAFCTLNLQAETFFMGTIRRRVVTVQQDAKTPMPALKRRMPLANF
jgi:hypothetical protein